MVSALNKLPDGTIELTIIIPWQKVKIAYDEVLKKQTKKIEVKGFRKGKAPQKLAEQKIGKINLYETVLKNLIPQIYLEAVKEQKVKPILNPQIQVISFQEGKDWQIKALTCELPEVKLNNYQAEVKKATAADKIWTPDKEKKSTREDKMAKIFKTLLETTQVKLPEILVKQEVDGMLARLIDQTNKLGLTIEQYLNSVGKSSQGLKEEYRKQAEETLKLELILTQIAENDKVTVSDGEVEKMIEAIPDENTRQEFKNSDQKIYVHQLLRKRKVIDSLLNL